MHELEFYICRAGQSIDQYNQEQDRMEVDELGVIGCLYVFRGVYVRSPSECVNNDKMEIMELESMANGSLCLGSMDSFTSIPATSELIDWANARL